MRRKDKEVTDQKEIEEIIRSSDICHLGMVDDAMPYVVPMNFGYENGALYLHCAREGKKLDILRQNNNVCFTVDCGHKLKLAEHGVNCTMHYRSVIGFGKAFFLDNLQEKKAGLDALMHHYVGDTTRSYDYGEAIKLVEVIKITIDSMTGKVSK